MTSSTDGSDLPDLTDLPDVSDIPETDLAEQIAGGIEEGMASVDDIDMPGDGAGCSDDQIHEFIEAAKEGVPLESDDHLSHAAKSTAKKAENSKTLVEELTEHLATAEVHGKIRRFHVPPEYQQVFAGATIQGSDKSWYVQTVGWFKAIVDKYAGGFYDPTTVDQDILKLQAQMVYFSSWVNHLDSVSTDAESTLKQAESRAYLEGRNWIEAHGINPRTVGSDMLHALAAENISDRVDWFRTAKTTSETVKGFYYALKDFIAYLDRVSQRSGMDRSAGRKHA